MKAITSIFLFFAIIAPQLALADDLVITQGDTVTFQLTAFDDDDTEHDLTGASFTTTLKGQGGALVTVADSAHTEDPDQATNPGEFTMSLTAAQTLALSTGTGKEILTKVTQGSNIRYYRSSSLTVKPNVPAQ